MTNPIADLIYELGSARRILRSHKQFIGTSDESISDHTFRVVLISLILSQYYPTADVEKILIMATIHDIAEIRTGDMNPVNRRYNKTDESTAFREQTQGLGKLGHRLNDIFSEYLEKQSIESKIVKDADIIEQIALQQEYAERGVTPLYQWYNYQTKLLRLKESRDICKELINTSSFNWLHLITFTN